MRAFVPSLLVALFLSCAAHAYQLLGAVWDVDKGPVEFHLEPQGSDDLDDGRDLDAVRAAFRAWACVEGSRLRFREASEPGVKEIDLSDGRNSVFWDEDGTFGLGPATLGITYGTAPSSPEETVVRDAADIVFNGVDHVWTTDPDEILAGKVDVMSIALHEIGHLLGLGHPCDDPQETQCKPPEKAVMYPVWQGTLDHAPREDDIAGLRALYPATDESRCDGPYRQGEHCACNDECIAGLVCAPALDGSNVCSPTCSSEDATCPAAFACVLGPRPGEDGVAQGACRKLADDGRKPPAALCQRDGECQEGSCRATPVIGRTVCRSRCEKAADCPEGYRCIEEVCVGGGESPGIACPSDEPPQETTCGCTSASMTPRAPLVGALALLALPFCLNRSPRRPGPAVR